MWSHLFVCFLLSQPTGEGRAERPAASSDKVQIAVSISEDGIQAVLVTLKDVQKLVLLETESKGDLKVIDRISIDPVTGEAISEMNSDEGGVASTACASNAVGGVCCVYQNAGISHMVCTCCVSMACNVCLNVPLL